MRISDWSSDVCSSDLEEFERPLPCDLRVLRAVVGALVAVEAVAGRVDVDLDLGMRLPHGVHVAHRNALVRFAEVQHHRRSEEHTSELQSLMRISYAVFCLKKKKKQKKNNTHTHANHITKQTQTHE